MNHIKKIEKITNRVLRISINEKHYIYKCINIAEFSILRDILKFCADILPEVVSMEYDDNKFEGHIIMELCSMDLKKIIGLHASVDKVLIMKQLSVNVKKLHSNGIAHRDIKPENVLMCCKGTKIIDFETSTKNRYEDDLLGTIDFLAPEIIRIRYEKDTGKTDAKYDPFVADIWSLGITFFYILFGKIPWKLSINDPDATQILEMNKYMKHYSNIFSNYTFRIATIASVKQVFIPCKDKIVKSLLTGMLEANPEKRMNIDQVLSHSFFTD